MERVEISASKDIKDAKTKEVIDTVEGTVEYDFPESTAEAVEAFGEAPTNNLIRESLRRWVQSTIRRYAENGYKGDDLQKAVEAAKPGIGGRKVDPMIAYREKLVRMTPEEQKAEMAKLKELISAQS